MDAHIPILKRAGMVLVVLGTCDLLALRSGVFLLSAAAGIGLLCGSLHVASMVRWIAAFGLCALGVMMLAWPLMQPVDLTLAQLKLQPRILPSLLTSATWLVLLHWLYRTLGAPAVLAARNAAGHKPRHMGLPAASGAGLAALLCAMAALLLHGEAAERALLAAERQFGPDYRYHVAALKVSNSGNSKQVEGLVTAWNASEIRHIPVAWQEEASGGQ
ncbi:hypothetical protein [Pseudoduganella violaceinigra]|uniref:hypothetical protein n=1 Tax=Pseudoduganella violaceinigra TaxID=246602 RepID=UPI000402B8D9|nr:hypothetical protein [Pseudoduganella violaceinigra]